MDLGEPLRCFAYRVEDSSQLLLRVGIDAQGLERQWARVAAVVYELRDRLKKRRKLEARLPNRDRHPRRGLRGWIQAASRRRSGARRAGRSCGSQPGPKPRVALRPHPVVKLADPTLPDSGIRRSPHRFPRAHSMNRREPSIRQRLPPTTLTHGATEIDSRLARTSYPPLVAGILEACRDVLTANLPIAGLQDCRTMIAGRTWQGSARPAPEVGRGLSRFETGFAESTNGPRTVAANSEEAMPGESSSARAGGLRATRLEGLTGFQPTSRVIPKTERTTKRRLL